jgi:type IV fimbrial biogenesis protein FimT
MVARIRTGGFTIIELLSVLAVIAVLGAVAAPAFSQMIANQRAKGAAADLFSSLLRARSEAITRNTEVTLQSITSGYWQGGWRIPNPANSGNLIEDHGPVPLLTITGPASVVYLANGRLKGSVAPSFQLTAPAPTTARCIRIDLSGRPKQQNGNC